MQRFGRVEKVHPNYSERIFDEREFETDRTSALSNLLVRFEVFLQFVRSRLGLNRVELNVLFLSRWNYL